MSVRNVGKAVLGVLDNSLQKGVKHVPENLVKMKNTFLESERVLGLLGEEKLALANGVEDLEGIKNFIYEADSAVKGDDLGNSILNLTKNETDLKKIKTHSQGLVNERIENANLQAESKFRYFESRMTKQIYDEGGEESLGILKAFNADVAKAEQIYNISEKDFVLALLNPEQATDPRLKIVGKAYKNMDEEYIKYVQDTAYVGNIKDYVLPIAPSYSALKGMGAEGYENLLLKHTDMLPKDAKKYSKRVYDDIGIGEEKLDLTPSQTRDVFDKQIRFKSAEDQYEFMRAQLEGDDQVSFFGKILQHKELQLSKTLLYTELGQNPVQTIQKQLSRVVENANVDDTSRAQLAYDLKNDVEKYLVKSVELSLGKGYQENSNLRLYADALDKFVSGAFGAPASLVRQIMTDTTGQAITLNNALLSANTLPGHINQTMFKPLKNLMKTLATGGKDSPIRRELDGFLHTLNFSTANNSLFVGSGMRMESFYGAVANQGSKDLVGEAGRALSSMSDSFNAFMNKVSGNSLHFDTVSAIRVWNTSHAFTNMTLKRSYDEIVEAWGINRVKYLENTFGIGETELRALKEAPPELIKTPELSKTIGFDESSKILTPDSIKRMPDDIAKKYKRATETVETFKARLSRSYHNMLTHQRQLSQVTVSRANRITARALNRGTLIDLIIRPFTKFGDITHIQADAIRKGLSIALYGNPWEMGFIPANRTDVVRGWGRAYATYGAFSVSTIWAKDVLSGRDPRPMGPHNAFSALASSGVMGIPGSILGSFEFSGTGFYGSTPLGGLIKDARRAGDSPYRFGKALQRATGVGKLSYASGLVDQILKEALLEEGEAKSMDAWYKKNIGSGRLFEDD